MLPLDSCCKMGKFIETPFDLTPVKACLPVVNQPPEIGNPDAGCPTSRIRKLAPIVSNDLCHNDGQSFVRYIDLKGGNLLFHNCAYLTDILFLLLNYYSDANLRNVSDLTLLEMA